MITPMSVSQVGALGVGTDTNAGIWLSEYLDAANRCCLFSLKNLGESR
jgi:hypothetical protein